MYLRLSIKKNNKIGAKKVTAVGSQGKEPVHDKFYYEEKAK